MEHEKCKVAKKAEEEEENDLDLDNGKLIFSSIMYCTVILDFYWSRAVQFILNTVLFRMKINSADQKCFSR